MEEKRFFYDKVKYWGEKEASVLFAILLICISILITVIIMHDNGYVLDLYSSEIYEDLNQIAETVITEGVGIDLSKISKNISSYKLNYENDEFTFEFWIDDEDISKYQPKKSMKVYLSSDYMILYRESPYSAEDEYTNKVDILIVTDIICYALLISFAIFGVGGIIFFIAYSISKSKKFTYEAKKNKHTI